MYGVQLKHRKVAKGLMLMFEQNYRSVDYGKQCLLVWSRVEERG